MSEDQSTNRLEKTAGVVGALLGAWIGCYLGWEGGGVGGVIVGLIGIPIGAVLAMLIARMFFTAAVYAIMIGLPLALIVGCFHGIGMLWGVGKEPKPATPTPTEHLSVVTPSKLISTPKPTPQQKIRHGGASNRPVR